jgi:hypothetical protein
MNGCTLHFFKRSGTDVYTFIDHSALQDEKDGQVLEALVDVFMHSASSEYTKIYKECISKLFQGLAGGAVYSTHR